MTQYVIQIQDSNGWLAKCFTVTEESPIPSTVPTGRTQDVMTNTTSYDEIVADYNQYTTALVFSYDQPADQISVTGPVTNTWDAN